MSATLEVRVLGPLAVYRDGEPIALPQSKKTRGLLGYLAITGRPHRRDRLCSLLWDVADDPRGALRWSLSKIRPLVDADETRRLVADREQVELRLGDGDLDWERARREVAPGIEHLSTERLEALLVAFRGELLEGLDLLDFDEFTAWCAAEREHARNTHVQLLSELVARYREEPNNAIAFARELVRIDPLDQGARADLIRLLSAAGHRHEAASQYQSAIRLLHELGSKVGDDLASAALEIRTPAIEKKPAGDGDALTRGPQGMEGASTLLSEPVVGRSEERARLRSVYERTADEGRLQVFLLKGESGVGKTTLLRELTDHARGKGGIVFEGTAYEAEAGRPYGPWIDALRRLPKAAIARDQRGALAPLLPELGTRDGDDNEQSRDRLFGAVVEVIASQATAKAPVLLLFDDIHWCDDATAELLHYVTRVTRDHPVAVVLGARDGELIDNASAMRVLRSFRREGVIDEHLLLPLGEQDIGALVESIGSEADPAKVFAQSGGNPLLARELASAASGTLPSSLKEIVRDRVSRLPPETGDVLRWAATLGPTFDVERLVELVSLEFNPLMNALDTLERHTLLRSETGHPGTYAFNHALVHHVVHSGVSGPRRKLMHLRVARLLEGRADPDGEVAMEIAHHAGVGGDSLLAAKACIKAGARCLKIFANPEAYAHARRGLRYAEGLPDPERLKLRIELEQVAMTARTPDDVESEARRIESLGEQALEARCPEHARLAFTTVSYLRWTLGEAGDAHRLSLRAELASRGTDDEHRTIGMAEAARCLVILERDIDQAETLLLEAQALTERSGVAQWPVLDGLGLLKLHAGELNQAKATFEDAWSVAKRTENRLHEFMSLEHLVTVSIYLQEVEAACELARELAIIGEKLREGSERPLGRAMLALCQYQKGAVDYRAALEDGLRQLREADAKQRLSFVLIHAALLECERGEFDSAELRADEALALSEALQHPSHLAVARAILLRVARERGDQEHVPPRAQALAGLRNMSVPARHLVDRELAAASALDTSEEASP